MPEATRRADVVWDGNLVAGAGRCTVGSGVLRDSPVTWAARVERPDGKTSPEELIAAAHASCYAMALAHTLTEAGHAPTRLEVTAEVTGTLGDTGLAVTSSVLRVRGSVPGVDAAGFADYAEQGEAACPVSNALRGNVRITVEATLVV